MEKRRHPRFNKRIATKILADQISFTCMTNDISEKGLFIKTSRSIAVNTPVDIQLLLPGNRFSFLKGIVRRTIGTPVSTMKNALGIEIIEQDETFINFMKSSIRGNEINTKGNYAETESQIISCSNLEVENKVLEDDIKEKRQHNRHKLYDNKINVQMELANEVKVIDISVGGILLKTDRKLDLRKQYILKLVSKDRVINVLGAVKWSSLSEYKKYSSDRELIPIYTSGMQFTHVSNNSIEELAQFIEENRDINIDINKIGHQNELVNLSEYFQEELKAFGKISNDFQDTSRDIRKKSIVEKRKTALLCEKGERSILLNDPNREIVLAVIENPKITETEIERIAKSPTISEEIINKIIQKREWMKSYGIISALVNNPKTPPYIAATLVNKLKTRDLKKLERNKGVSQVVSSTAKKLLCDKRY